MMMNTQKIEQEPTKVYEFKDIIDDPNQLERVISYKDITDNFHKEDGQQIDIVLYRYKDKYFITEEMFSPQLIQFFGKKYDVTPFMKPGKCLACMVGAPKEHCLCRLTEFLH